MALENEKERKQKKKYIHYFKKRADDLWNVADD